MALKHKTAYLKLLFLLLSPLPIFFSMQLLKCDLSCSFCLPLAHADDILFFYRNACRSLRVNRCHHRTVYTHVVAKFIRSMSHSVTCSDLIGLLKSCSVFWALEVCITLKCRTAKRLIQVYVYMLYVCVLCIFIMYI